MAQTTSYNKSALALAGLLAVFIALAYEVDWTQAQKTSRNSFQQSSYSSGGSNPNSVYGGYDTQPRSPANSLVGGQQRRTQQSYSSSRQTVRQPQQVVASSYQQQQEQVSSSSGYDQAEADAEPAQYGKWSNGEKCHLEPGEGP